MKLRSGMRALPQRFEKAVHFVPDGIATGESAPFDPNQAGQLIALIDGSDEMTAMIARPVDEQRLHIRLHLPQYRIVANKFLPSLERQKGLGASRRARVISNHAFSN